MLNIQHIVVSGLRLRGWIKENGFCERLHASMNTKVDLHHSGPRKTWTVPCFTSGREGDVRQRLHTTEKNLWRVKTWRWSFTARANAALQPERRARDVQSLAVKSNCCQMHRGRDEDEPSPSGQLEAKLKTTPALSPAPQLHIHTSLLFFPRPLFFFFPASRPVSTSRVFLKLRFSNSRSHSGVSNTPPPPPPPRLLSPSQGFITLNYLNYPAS